MEKDLSAYRASYEKGELLEQHVSKDNPMELFQQWFYEADNFEGIAEANAMNLATIGLDGFPKNRIVLLKKYTYEGFIFYTNYNSEKGKAILENPKVCASFFWPGLERQIIIKGTVEKIADNLSEGYFETRPRGSQLGALVSNQSEVIESKDVLRSQMQTLESEYEGKEIPRPDHWGGYIVKPQSIEFWQGRPNRLHDRLRYQLDSDYNWILERLAP